MMLKKLFKPDLMLDKYTDLDIKGLASQGFTTVLLDVDNTITPYYQKIPDENGKDFVKKMKEAGLDVIVFSNNTDERVGKVAAALDCDYRCWCLKPLPFKFNKLIKEKKLDRNKVICMGDQLMTDILGGNSAGVYTVYMRPIVEHDAFITTINRKLERFVFKHILHEEM